MIAKNKWYKKELEPLVYMSYSDFEKQFRSGFNIY